MEFAAPSIWSEAEGGWLASMGGNGGWPVLGSGRLLFSLFPSNRLRRLETLFADDEVFPCSAGDGEVSILLVFVFIITFLFDRFYFLGQNFDYDIT